MKHAEASYQTCIDKERDYDLAAWECAAEIARITGELQQIEDQVFIDSAAYGSNQKEREVILRQSLLQHEGYQSLKEQRAELEDRKRRAEIDARHAREQSYIWRAQLDADLTRYTVTDEGKDSLRAIKNNASREEGFRYDDTGGGGLYRTGGE